MTGLTAFLKAISDETRLRIMLVLFTHELCVCELCDVLQESQPKISRHLAILRTAGYVTDMRQGQWVFYYPSIEHELLIDLIQCMVKKHDKLPLLKNDFDRLSARIEKNRLCARTRPKEQEDIDARSY